MFKILIRTHINFAHLISGRFELDFWAAPDHNESVEKVALDAGRGKGSVVGFQEHDANDVIADVTFALELKEILQIKCFIPWIGLLKMSGV
jgi:hypothetical protein